MTYKEAIANGWKDADDAYTLGYVSRVNFCADEAECHEAGGTRKGYLYILEPCRHSTRFCWRHYLKK